MILSGINMKETNLCNKCYMSKESEWFWEAHQTMSDNTIWCVNSRARGKS
jgi:hypothetical protein